MVPQIIFVDNGAKRSIHGFSGNLNLTQKYICPIHNIEQIIEEDVVSKKDDKPTILKRFVDGDWYHMCSGSNLDRKVYGEDHSKYPPAPFIVKKPVS